MKRTLALILAALILASSIVSCGNGGVTEPKETIAETKSPETQAAETQAPATEASETDAPAPIYPYDTTMITENGIAKAHIVLLDGASAKEQTAAEELAYHIKLVSGADITVTNTVQEDSISIIVASPQSLPELEELFPEDLAWLRVTEETNANSATPTRWGPDGFAIRQLDGKIYIFGATAEGTLNGVYDFIEDNLGVLWIKTTDDGIIYDEMPTITVEKNSYREKSPFSVRYGFGSQLLDQRNKHDTTTRITGSAHNVKGLVTSSPSYDPTCTEYWENYADGTPLTPSTSRQINYWSELTASVVADSVIAKLDAYTDENRPKIFSVSQEDLGFVSGVYPNQNEPFEYAPGQFIAPSNPKYISTVYFTFINRVARKVAEKYPDVSINTLAYAFSQIPPECELEPNVSIWFCPYTEQYADASFAETYELGGEGYFDDAVIEIRDMYEWAERFPNTPMVIFDYYYCHYVGGWYERAIWDRVQSDFQYYAEIGGLGTYSCGSYNDASNSVYTWTDYARDGKDYSDYPYIFTHADAHAMNLLSEWLFYKLTWNPYEDVDALIVYFCDKVYGDASDAMQEYYRILSASWEEGGNSLRDAFNAGMALFLNQEYYFNYFIDIDVDGINAYQAMQEALAKAWEAADDTAKEFIRRAYECYSDWERFLQ